jgi:hypothetical protein
MGLTGTDVSKEAASTVLSDDNCTSIAAAVEEGRSSNDDIRRFSSSRWPATSASCCWCSPGPCWVALAMTSVVLVQIFQALAGRSQRVSVFTLNPLSNRRIYWKEDPGKKTLERRPDMQNYSRFNPAYAFAANRPEVLDPALLRAGHFDRHVLVDRTPPCRRRRPARSRRPPARQRGAEPCPCRVISC